MAGHSKWANIKHRKKAQDAKRGKVFTKLIRELTIAARLGGADASSNPRLRAAISAALGANMTRDTVDRAVARGAGTDESIIMIEARYEGYGVNGVAVMVDCLTDNKNRTVAEVRHGFSKSGGNMGTDGSVAYLFTQTGIVIVAPGVDEDTVMEIAIEAGADDVEVQDDGHMAVTMAPAQFGAVVDALESAKIKLESAEVTMIASITVELDLDGAHKLMKMVDLLEDLDDVQNVYTNADISSEVLEQLDA